MSQMANPERIAKMYVKNDTLSTRIELHDKYSVNKYGWGNWVFDQYTFQDNMNILELGCGSAGIWLNRDCRLPKHSKIVLSDYSALMVEKAKSLLHDSPSFTFEQMDIQNIPYDSNSFDIVIANHMLYHVPDQEKALAQVYRVLKAGGHFYATTLGKNSLKELQIIYRKLEDKASFSYSENVSFTLENGKALLGRYFSDIEQRQYVDALHITNIDDLIAYIKSYNDVPDSAQAELYDHIQNGFSKDGVFYLSKEQGMFICKK